MTIEDNLIDGKELWSPPVTYIDVEKLTDVLSGRDVILPRTHIFLFVKVLVPLEQLKIER